MNVNVGLSVVFFSAPSHPPANVMWIQEGNNVSLSWDPVKALDNESDVIGYRVRYTDTHIHTHTGWCLLLTLVVIMLLGVITSGGAWPQSGHEDAEHSCRSHIT